MTNIVTTIADWREIRAAIKERVGFVPTMGNLHDGHLSLLKKAQHENAIVVASIFINRAQFNNDTDYQYYPKTLEADIEKLSALSVDYVFVPTHEELYPDCYQVRVQESMISTVLEGQYRPGHFDGMLTVVLKLLNIIQPMRAYFGEKDYQQLILIKKMVASFFLPVDIISSETIRAPDLLALSSRNHRLSLEERKKAAIFAQLLASSHSCDEVISRLHAEGFRIDYIEEKWGRRLGAVWIGDVRLIDNVAILGGSECVYV